MKTKNESDRGPYGILRFKIQVMKTHQKRYGQPFNVIEADKIMTNMREGKGLKVEIF